MILTFHVGEWFSQAAFCFRPSTLLRFERTDSATRVGTFELALAISWFKKTPLPAKKHTSLDPAWKFLNVSCLRKGLGTGAFNGCEKEHFFDPGRDPCSVAQAQSQGEPDFFGKDGQSEGENFGAVNKYIFFCCPPPSFLETWMHHHK